MMHYIVYLDYLFAAVLMRKVAPFFIVIVKIFISTHSTVCPQ